MTTELITEGVWDRITSIVKEASRPADVAVAYFGQGAARLLPLPAGSCLVVDASEGAVKSGQTSPKDLLALHRKGVHIYSVPNLHAKVFVVGNRAIVGSANVSSRSASGLVEAVLLSTEKTAVAAARKFVRDSCVHNLGPERLKGLSKLYVPPRVPGGRRSKPRKKTGIAIPAIQLAQLHLESWTEEQQASHNTGWEKAKKKAKRSPKWELTSYRRAGKVNVRPGDVVVQILDEGRGKRLMDAPGTVLYLKPYGRGNRHGAFVYLELRAGRRRRDVRRVAKALGRGALKKLKTDGQIRNKEFGRRLLKFWQ